MKLKIEFLKKYSNRIYILILIFSTLFYLLLMGASGHGFHLNSTDKIAFIFALCGIIIVPNYKNKRIGNKSIRILILIASIIISIGTIIIGCLVLKNSIEFKYGKDVSPVTIGLFYIIPLIFIIINGIVINGITTELRK
jgi:hypothetical protein